MTDAEKQAVRAEFSAELVEAQMNEETLKSYLESDLSLTPLQFQEEHGPDKDMEAFLADEFPGK